MHQVIGSMQFVPAKQQNVQLYFDAFDFYIFVMGCISLFKLVNNTLHAHFGCYTVVFTNVPSTA